MSPTRIDDDVDGAVPDRQPRRAVPLLAAAAALVALPVLGYAGWLCYETATYVPRPGEDVSLHGVGYVVAGAVAAPAGLAMLFAVLALWSHRRGRSGLGMGLGIVALVALTPFLLFTSGRFLF